MTNRETSDIYRTKPLPGEPTFTAWFMAKYPKTYQNLADEYKAAIVAQRRAKLDRYLRTHQTGTN